MLVHHVYSDYESNQRFAVHSPASCILTVNGPPTTVIASCLRNLQIMVSSTYSPERERIRSVGVSSGAQRQRVRDLDAMRSSMFP
ncbi:hypothetical protein HPP92_015284 [Vanilla planifolia]|nr:hypothetical protein HPP92_015284 [Vanilla planifolia]